MIASKIDSDFLRYLVTNACRPGDRLPPLEKLKIQLGLSMIRRAHGHSRPSVAAHFERLLGARESI